MTFGFETTAEEATEGVDLSGKTFVVTGCNSGLGLETARVLTLRGARVIGTARTKEKAEAALADFEGAVPLECELSEPASARACAAALLELGPLDGIVCNAGIMALPEANRKHGVELQMLTNHIGHFTLVTGALDALADDARVVMVSSGAHHMIPESGIELDDLSAENGYDQWQRYGQSKLANILFAKQLAKRFEGTARTANALHPGVIRTNLARHLPDRAEGMISKARVKTIPQGAATQTYLATHPDLADVSGQYYADCQPKGTHERADDVALAESLWAKTEEILAGL